MIKEKIKEKFFIKIASYIIMIIGMVFNFVIHELSHLLVLWICGGNVTEFSLFTGMFVSGSISQKYISIVALSSIFIPFTISFALSFAKSKWITLWDLGFTVPIIINIVFGLYALFYMKNITLQNTYDLSLAYNFVENGQIIIILSVVVLIVLIFEITKLLKNLKENI